MIKGDVIFCATGVTDGDLVKGIKDLEDSFVSETLVLHKSSKTNKIIKNQIKLSREQKICLEKMNISNQKFRVHVLQGTTGSGKTMVYFEALKQLIMKDFQFFIPSFENYGPKRWKRFMWIFANFCSIFAPDIKDPQLRL